MRLIDADKLKGKCICSRTYCGVNKLAEMDSIPTAYDVDNVVERLEERKNYLLKDFVLADKAGEVKERTMARINEIDGLIEIVKSGGIE